MRLKADWAGVCKMDVAQNRNRAALVGISLIILTAAAWAGLLRMGWSWPPLQPTLPINHGALMAAGFFGALISLERAVAMGKAWAYGAPLTNGIGGLLIVFGVSGISGPLLITIGSIWLVAIFIVVLRQHLTDYTAVMALGAVALLIGNLLWMFGWPVYRVVMWWSGFLVLTIVGERLELGRMMRPSQFAKTAFWIATGIYILGLIAIIADYNLGMRITGIGTIALGLWLLAFDIARRTVRMDGLTRYIAVCLLSGYVWLLVGGGLAVIYGGVPAGPIYDAILHSVFLGFVFAMIFGHAPIIFPAVLGVKIPYRNNFYAPLILLHASLILRILGDLAGAAPARQWGGLINEIAVLLYFGVIIWNRKK